MRRPCPVTMLLFPHEVCRDSLPFCLRPSRGPSPSDEGHASQLKEKGKRPDCLDQSEPGSTIPSVRIGPFPRWSSWYGEQRD